MNNYRKPTPNSKKLFTATADRTHKINFNQTSVMRGGLRL